MGKLKHFRMSLVIKLTVSGNLIIKPSLIFIALYIPKTISYIKMTFLSNDLY